MVRTKLVDQLKLEIQKYLGIPYFSNTSSVKSNNNAMVGKGTAKEIALTVIDMANKQNIRLQDLSAIEIYHFYKKNKIGIDCSGLVYHLCDYYYYLKTGKNIYSKLVGTEGKKGPRRLSANLLTSLPNAIAIKNLNDIQTADLIRMDQGKHVIFIIEKTKNKINYVHSSQKTKQKGVHYGQIKIINPSQDLSRQQWSEILPDNRNYVEHFNPKDGDGVFRLKVFT